MLDIYLLQATTERISPGPLSGYAMALCSIVFKMPFFSHMAFLITSVNRLSGAFFLDDHSLLATILIASVGNTQ